MPLTNFGSILNFAEELEDYDEAFYAAAIAIPAFSGQKEVFEQFIADCQKNKKTIRRIRRENVIEMNLEAINDFTRDPYRLECKITESMSAEALFKAAGELEERAERYYLDAAEKIKTLADVSRGLKTLAKKRTAHRKKLADL